MQDLGPPSGFGGRGRLIMVPKVLRNDFEAIARETPAISAPPYCAVAHLTRLLRSFLSFRSLLLPEMDPRG